MIYLFQFEELHEFVGVVSELRIEIEFLHLQSIFIIMELSYQEYCNQMNKVYFSVYNWPQPYHYQQWFEGLTSSQQAVTVHPAYYTQIYTYTLQNCQKPTQNTAKPPPLSRGQKRRKKKQELQEELQRERKQIGDWVRLERKDLIQGLEKMQKKDEKKRKKKEDKLSHLIQINKEVSKHYLKKNVVNTHSNKRVNMASNKKRISYVKKLKQVFDKNKMKFIGLHNQEEEWESDREEEKQPANEKQLQQIAKLEGEVKEISYSNVSKLTGIRHNNILLREWVRNYPSEKLDDLVLRVVNRLAYKQAIRRVQKPDKAKKLIVSGLKECKRTLTTIIDKKKSKMLIVALNIQRNPYKGGVDDQVLNVIEIAQQMKIPVIHACLRSHLGRAFSGKWGPRATMISIINYEGYQDMIEEMIGEWKDAVKKYESLP